MTIKDGLLTIRVDEHPAMWCVALTGELDEATADTLEAELRKLDDGNPISLDLSGLEFMNAAGIELLVRLASDGTQGGRQVGVARSSKAVERLLSVCGLGTADHMLVNGASSARAA